MTNPKTPKVYTETKGMYTHVVDPLWIQCSSQQKDRTLIHLPKASLYHLGLEDYDISTYGYVTREKNNAKNAALKADPKNWTDEVVSYSTSSGVVKNANGEYVRGASSTSSYTTKKYTGPTLEMETVYEYKPSNLSDVQNAIDLISGYRGTLGAEQNRLEHTRNNVMNMTENLTSAESRIRDTDMAEEIAKMTKMNILTQAAQSMHTQANQNPNSILQLLSA